MPRSIFVNGVVQSKVQVDARMTFSAPTSTTTSTARSLMSAQLRRINWRILTTARYVIDRAMAKFRTSQSFCESPARGVRMTFSAPTGSCRGDDRAALGDRKRWAA